ncbi:MAG TPA: hypothetical protein VFG20_07080 [Planctomycetaceae bacterium]|nr:hypothetical protein [Planctomycetaceae bacterium]
MNVLKMLWNDDQGAILSAEVVTVGTVAVLGAVAGLSVASNAVDGELKDFSYAIRSLDQSYSINGHHSCGAWTAGSCFTQRDVQESIQSLCAEPDTAVINKTDESPTPMIVPDANAPKDNQLPEPTKKPAKKKPKNKKDDDGDEERDDARRPPQSRVESDA